MHRILLAALFSVAASASAQTIFVAPSSRTILGSTEQSNGAIPAHVLMVANQSTVPIVVFGVTITQCENVRQWCGGQRTKILIEPGATECRSCRTVELRAGIQLSMDFLVPCRQL